MYKQSFALYQYIGILWRRKWVVLAPIVLGVAGVVAASLWLPHLNSREYEASAVLRLALAGRGGNDVSPVTNAEAQRVADTSAYILTSRSSVSAVIAGLGLKVTPEELQRRISVKPIPDTELLTLTVSASSPREAQQVANTLAAAWPKQAATFYNSINSPGIASGFAVAEQATLPSAPLGLAWSKRIALGLFAGLMAGLCLALVFDYTDRTVNSIDDLRNLAGVTVLGGVTRPPVMASGGASLMTLSGSFDPLDSPEARLLAVKVLRTVEERHLPSLMVTSTWEKEGATSVAISVALGLVRNGMEVHLVDADLAAPSLHTAFGLSAKEPGLTDVLASVSEDADLRALIDKVLQESPVPGLGVLTGGSTTPDSWNLLGSREMHELIDSYKGAQSLMVIDGPPLSSADAFAMASVVGGVVVVCGEGKTTVDDLQQRLNQLTSLGANVLGVVYCGRGTLLSPAAAEEPVG